MGTDSSNDPRRVEEMAEPHGGPTKSALGYCPEVFPVSDRSGDYSSGDDRTSGGSRRCVGSSSVGHYSGVRLFPVLLVVGTALHRPCEVREICILYLGCRKHGHLV
jgi:hypothetical protein